MAGTDDWISPDAKNFFGLLPPIQSPQPVAPPDSWAGQAAPLPEYRYTPPIPPQQFLNAIGAPAAPDAMTAAQAPPVAPPVSPPALSGPVAPPPSPPPSDDSLHPGETGDQYANRIRIKNQSDFGAGLDVGVLGLKQLGAGVAGAIGQAAEGTAIGDALGAGEVHDWGVQKYRALEQEMQPYQEGRVSQLEQIESIGDVGRFAAWSVGQMAPSIVESIGSALVGAAAGSFVPGAGTAAGAAGGFFAKAATKKFLADYAVKEMAKDVTGKVITKEIADIAAKRALAQTVGAGAAMFASSYAMGVGDIYGETMDETGNGSVGMAALGALPYAALDAFTDLSVFKSILRGTGGDNALARFAKGILTAGAKEGSAEAGQEAILMLAGAQAGKEYDQGTVMSRLGNSFAAAAIGGGVLGVGAGRKGPTDQEREAGTLSALATVGLRTAGENAPVLNMALGNANADPAQRMAAAAQVDAALRGDGLEDLADLWRPMAEKAIKAKEPIQPTSVQAVATSEAARAVAAKQAAIRKGAPEADAESLRKAMVAEGANKASDQAERIAEIEAGRKRAAAARQETPVPEVTNVEPSTPEGTVPQPVEPTGPIGGAPAPVEQPGAMGQPVAATETISPEPGPDVAVPESTGVSPVSGMAVERLQPEASLPEGTAPVAGGVYPVTMPEQGGTGFVAAPAGEAAPSRPYKTEEDREAAITRLSDAAQNSGNQEMALSLGEIRNAVEFGAPEQEVMIAVAAGDVDALENITTEYVKRNKGLKQGFGTAQYQAPSAKGTPEPVDDYANWNRLTDAEVASFAKAAGVRQAKTRDGTLSRIDDLPRSEKLRAWREAFPTPATEPTTETPLVPKAEVPPTTVTPKKRGRGRPGTQTQPPVPAAAEVGGVTAWKSPAEVVKAYRKSKHQPGEGSFDGATIENMAKGPVRKLVNRLDAGEWSQAADMTPKDRRGTKHTSTTNGILSDLRGLGLTQIGWDREGNAYHAKAGAPVPAWITTNPDATDADFAALPARGGAAPTETPTPEVPSATEPTPAAEPTAEGGAAAAAPTPAAAPTGTGPAAGIQPGVRAGVSGEETDQPTAGVTPNATETLRNDQGPVRGQGEEGQPEVQPMPDQGGQDREQPAEQGGQGADEAGAVAKKSERDILNKVRDEEFPAYWEGDLFRARAVAGAMVRAGLVPESMGTRFQARWNDAEDLTDSIKARIAEIEWAGVAPQPTAEPNPAKPFLVSDDRMAEIRKRLAEKGRNLSSGVDPELFALGAELAVGNIERGIRKFADFARAAISDLGDWVKPYLRGWYENARYYPGLNTAGMTPVAEMDAEVEMATAAGAEQPEPAENQTPPANTSEITQAQFDAVYRVVINGENVLTGVADALGMDGYKKDTIQGKLIEEVTEAAYMKMYREVATSDDSEKRRQQGIADIFATQPKFGSRTGTSAVNQAYSTPAPLAFAVLRMVGAHDNPGVVMDNTAGTGALLMTADQDTAIANELDPGRANLLRLAGFQNVTENNAIQWLPDQKVDTVATNPPFGKENGKATLPDGSTYGTSRLEHAIVMRQLEQLKPDGTAVIIVAGPNPKTLEKNAAPADRAAHYKTQNDLNFNRDLRRWWSVIEHVTIDGDLYKSQGAAWPVDVYVVAGRRDGTAISEHTLPHNINYLPRIIRTWEDLDALVQPVRERVDLARQQSADRFGGSTDGAGKHPGAGGKDGGRPRGRGKTGGKSPVPEGGAVGASGRPGGTTEPGTTGLSGAGVVVPGGRLPVEGNRPKNGGRPNTDGSRRNGVAPPPKGMADYPQQSNGQSLETYVPEAHAPGIESALKNLSERVGDLDDFVLDKLQYADTAELYAAFAAEQIDALALAIDNVDRDKGFIVADQTGVGKGRIVAGMIRYARLRGLVPVFMTEKPNLYVDMMRDLIDIGVTDLNPLLTNQDIYGKEALTLEDGRKLSRPKGNHTKTLSDAAGNWAGAGFDSVFTTYDQTNSSKGKLTPRHELLNAVAPNAMFILDESHNAGGVGVTEEQLAQEARRGKERLPREIFIRSLLAQAPAAVFSSATWAKRPQTMTLYATNTDLSFLEHEGHPLTQTIEAGGVPLQQSISALMAESGQLMRREKSFEGIEFDATTSYDVEISNADAAANTLAVIREFDDTYAQPIIRALASRQASTNQRYSSTGFASVMHNLIDQAFTSLKADAISDHAIEILNRGEKLVLGIANTNEAALTELVERDGVPVGGNIQFTLRDLYQRFLRNTLRYHVKDSSDPNDKGYYVWIDPATLTGDAATAYQNALATIDSIPAEIPGSPIDHIHWRLRDAGFTVGEITGRALGINYETGKLYKRPDTETGIQGRRTALTRFNGGMVDTPLPKSDRLDALIINRAGATGASMHSSEKFADQSARSMLLAQYEKNIDTFMQMLGRVNRTGQVVPPRYYFPQSNIPAETRLHAVLAKKLTSLNANVTGSGKSAVGVDVPEFMNQYGSIAAEEVLSNHDDMAHRMGGITGNSDTEDYIHKVTGRVGLLEMAQQEQFYTELFSVYEGIVEQAKAMGLNVGAMGVLPLEARGVRRRLVVPATGERPMQKAVYAYEIDAKLLSKPATVEGIKNEIIEFRTAKDLTGDARSMARQLFEEVQNKYEKFQEQEDRKQLAVIPGRISNAKRARDEAIKEDPATAPWTDADEDKIRDKVQDEVDKRRAGEDKARDALLVKMQDLGPATAVSVRFNQGGRHLYGLVARVERAGRARNPYQQSQWTATIYLATHEPRRITAKLSEIGPDEKFKFTVSHDTTMALVRDAFDLANEAVKSGRQKRVILTGNSPIAFQQFDGQITQFTDHTGKVGDGVLMPADLSTFSDLSRKALELKSGTDAMEYLRLVKESGDPKKYEHNDNVLELDRVAAFFFNDDGTLRFRVTSESNAARFRNRDVVSILQTAGLDFVRRKVWNTRVSSTGYGQRQVWDVDVPLPESKPGPQPIHIIPSQDLGAQVQQDARNRVLEKLVNAVVGLARTPVFPGTNDGMQLVEKMKGLDTLPEAEEVDGNESMVESMQRAIKETRYSRVPVVNPTGRVPKGQRPSGVSIADVQDMVSTFGNRMLGATAGRVPVLVFATQAQALGPGSVDKEGRIKGAFLPNSRQIILIVENMDSMADARTVFRHEAMHYGTLLLSKEEKTEFLNKVREATKRNRSLGRLWTQIEEAERPGLVRRLKDATPAEQADIAADHRLRIAEEVFARTVESWRTNLGVTWDKLLVWLRGVLRKYGLIEGRFGPADMRLMAADFAKGIREGREQKIFPETDRAQFATSDRRLDETDKAYLAAVERGDMETAQRMVDAEAVRKGYVSANDYRMAHSAPDRESYNLSTIQESDLVPQDYWTRPDWYQGTPEEMESWGKVNRALNRSKESGRTARFTVYRAVPKTSKESAIRNGDWVTPSESYARSEGQQINEGYRIISMTVPINRLWWDGNSIAELGYDDGKEYAYKNTKNNRKLMDPVTRDDDGNVIPLSQRFNLRNEDIRYSFAGERAQTADKMALETAQARLAVGDDAETVRKETGWFHGDDGKWRFEINDNKAVMLPGYEEYFGQPVSLGDVFFHPALFSSYPSIANNEIYLNVDKSFGAKVTAAFNSDTGIIEVTGRPREKESLASAILHEIQHAIQFIEGFAVGGQDGPNYVKLSGEVEARNVQRRKRLTAAERRATSPNETRDVPASDVIVVWNGKEMASAPRPENAGAPFTRREKPAPKKTVTAYKLFRVDPKRPGQLFPLFVGANNAVDVGVWYDAGVGELTGTGKVKSKLGPLAYRPGWHAGDLPLATHIGEGGQPPKYRPENQVWAEVEIADDVEWQSEANRRGTNAKGKLIPVKAHITDRIPEEGHYRYKTNPNMTGEWLIGGTMRVTRVLSDEEVSAINNAAGFSDLPRRAPLDIGAFGFGPRGDIRFSRTPTLQSDAAEQTAYLEQNAKRLGYADPDDLLVKNPAEFISLAEQWRDGHPRTDERGAVMFSRVVPDWVEPMSATYKEAAARLNIIKNKQTVGEWLADARLNFGKKMIQGVFDGFAPIKEFSNPGYMLARLSNTAPQGTLEAAFMNGLPTMGDDGALDVTEDMRHAFLPFLRKFNGEHDRFFGWVAGNRADEIVKASNRATRRAAQLKAQIARLRHDRLEAIKAGQSAVVKLLEADIREAAKHRKTAMEQAGITERNLSADQIAALKASNQDLMDDGTNRETFYNERLVEFNAMLKAYLDVAEKAGLIDGASRHIWERDFYVPFYRDIEEGRSGPTISSGLGGQYAFKRLKGGKNITRDLLENIVGNWSHLLAASAKNRAMQEVSKDAVATGIARIVPSRRVRIAGKKPNYITYRDNGREINLEVDDPMLFNALAAVNYTGLKGPVMTVLSKAKRYLTVGVTANPAFKFYRNMMRDAVTSIAVSELGYVPWKNAADGIKALNSPLGIHLMAGGGQMRFGTSWEGEGSLHIRRLIDAGVDPNTILSHPDKILNFWKSIWEKYQEAGDRVENMNRATLYKLLREQGKTHLEASHAALDLMDFSLHGIYPAVRLLTQIVPFMNARLQGLYKLGRAAHENPKRMATVAGAATLASIALLLAYKDDDDWKKREDWDRENFYWFKVGQTAFRIPMPFELGAIGSIVGRGLETFIADDFTKERFFERLGAIVGNQLAMNPVPQLVKPMLDVYANRDSFTGRPIETMGMERLQPQDRYTERTSEVARQLGKANVLSPAQIDNLIRGYFGWIGSTTTLILDQAARPAFGRPSRPETPMRSWTGGIAEDLANDPVRSRYVSQFYDQATKIEQAYASQREAARRGDFSRAGDFDANAAALAHAAGRTKKILTTLNTRKKEVERDAGMSPDAKAREIARLNERMSEVAARVRIPE